MAAEADPRPGARPRRARRLRGAVVAAGVFTVNRLTDPAVRHAAESRRAAEKLRRGEAVTLVPETGGPADAPRPARRVLHPGVRQPGRPLHRRGRPGGPGRVAGRPRHRPVPDHRRRPGGRVSRRRRRRHLLRHQFIDSDDGGTHVFARLQFADYGPLAVQYALPDGGRRSLFALDYVCATPPVLTGPDLTAHNGEHPGHTPTPARLLPGPWRRLSVEVTPEVVRAAFDGEQLRDHQLSPRCRCGPTACPRKSRGSEASRRALPPRRAGPLRLPGGGLGAERSCRSGCYPAGTDEVPS